MMIVRACPEPDVSNASSNCSGGIRLVRPDRTLYYGAVQTMPFARPHFDELLQAIDFAIDKNYPARGEYTGPG